MYARNIPRNGTPANVIYGTRDDSMLAPVLEPVVDNIHTPLVFGFAPMGEGNKAHLLQGETLFAMHGKEVVENGNKFSTFNTPFLKLFNEKANRVLFERLIPDDASTPTLRLFAEVFTKEIDAPKRDALNNIVRAGEGEPDPTVKIVATHVIYRVGQIGKDVPFGQAELMDGTNTNVDGTPSTVYPLYDIMGPYEGEYGRNFRFSFSCLNSKNSSEVDQDVLDRVGSRLFRLSIRKSSPVDAVGAILSNLEGGSGVTYSHARGAKDPSINRVYDYRYVISQGYIDKRPRQGIPAMPGPFKSFHVYEAFFNEMLTKLAEAEGVPAHTIDPFTALDIDGKAYTKIIVDKGEMGGEILNADHYQPLLGGSDGTMNNEVYDQLVRRAMDNFGSGPVPYLDMLRYPCSHLWDSGFTLETKQAMANFMGRRPNGTVVLVPFIYNKPSNDIETESSIVISLIQFLRAFPESTRYTTPALRGYIVGQDYLLNDKSYLDRVPLAYHLASMLCDYAGARSLRPEYRFFAGGKHTIIDTGYDVSLPWKPQATYEKDYENGLIYAIAYDDYRSFFPNLRSIYSKTNSVLVGMLPSLVIGDAVLVSQRVWADCTGAQTMTDNEYADYVSQEILNRTSDRYDTVKNIRPHAYFTAEDLAAGNQITIDIYIEFNTSKVIHKVSFIATRSPAGTTQSAV